MSIAKENLLQALTAAFSPARVDGTCAEEAQAAAAVLCAFAELIAPPAIALVADETPGLILVELRKITARLEVIARQGEITLNYITSASDPIHLSSTDTHGLPG